MIVLKFFFVSLLLAAANALAADSALSPTPAQPIPAGKQALTLMLKAMQTLNYQGTVVFFKNGKLEPMKYFHAEAKGREQERLLSLNSPLREIIRDTGNIRCLFKSSQQLVADSRPFEHSFLIDIPQNPDDLDTVYTVTVLGEENIALLPAYVIAIQAKDGLRYSRKIWLDKQHFLPLKVAVYNLSGDVLEQLVFTELEIKALLPFIDTKPTETDADHNKPQLQPSDQAAFIIPQLPPGFRERFFTRRLMHNSAQPVDHLLLSDGLASVSVYMEPRQPTTLDAPKDVQSIGAINFYSQPLGAFEFTVMGDVPSETVKLIARSIKLREKK